MSRLKQLRKESQVALPNTGETYVAEDGTVSMVLDDHDVGAPPTEQEVMEYAEWLGMIFPEDEELLWIAREGLSAPLPKEWKPCKTDTGEVYYFNFKTGESIWDHPMDEHFKNKFKIEKERLLRKKNFGEDAFDMSKKVGTRTNVIIDEKKGVIKMESPVSAEDSGSFSKKGSSQQLLTPVKKADGESSGSTKMKKEKEEQERKAKEQREKQRQKEEEEAEQRRRDEERRAEKERKAREKEEREREKREKKEREKEREREEAERVAKLQQQQQQSQTEAKNLFSVTSTKTNTTTTSPSSLLTPRLMSEAEKVMQETIRKEMEEQHKQMVAAMEAEFTDKLSKLKGKHDAECANIPQDIAAERRRELNRIESDTQDALQEQQDKLEEEAKRETSRLQRQADSLRDEVASIQRVPTTTIAREREAATREVDAEVERRLKDIRDEIADIRSRFYSTIDAKIAARQSELTTALERLIAEAKDKSAEEFAAKAAAMRQQHEELKQRLMAEAASEMSAEKERAQRATAGQEAALIEELNSKRIVEVNDIYANAESEVQRITLQEEGKLQSLRSIHSQQEQQAMSTTGGNSAALVEQIARSIEAETAAEIQSLTNNSDAELRATMTQLAAERTRRVMEAESALQQQHFNGDFDGDLVEIERTLRERYSSEEAALQAEVDAEVQRARAAAAETAVAAAQRQQQQLNEQFDQFKRQKGSEYTILAQQYAREEEQALASMSAAAVAATEEAKKKGIQQMRSRMEADHQRAQRELRAQFAEKQSQQIMALADELALYEQAERRRAEADIARMRQHDAVVEEGSSSSSSSSNEEEEEEEVDFAAPAPIEFEYVHEKLPPLPVPDLGVAVGALRHEFAEREAKMRQDHAQAMALLKYQSEMQQQQREMMAVEATPAVPSVGVVDGRPSEAALMFVGEQHRQMMGRQQALANARAEWEADLHHAQGAEERAALERVRNELERQEKGLREDFATIRQIVQGSRHDSPGRGGGGAGSPNRNKRGGGAHHDAAVISALQRLDAKLDELAIKVQAMQEGGGKLSAQQQQHHSPRRSNALRTSELAGKWSNIMSSLEKTCEPHSNRTKNMSSFSTAMKNYIYR